MNTIYTSPYFIIKKLQRNHFVKIFPLFKGTVLDLGCGTKPYKHYFSHSKYISMDTSPGLSPSVCGVSHAIPFKKESFDTVLCTEVLEHVRDLQSTLTEIKQVLKKGGYLYISLPQSWPLHYEPNDFWRFTCYGAEHLLTHAGLRVISTVKIGGIVSLLGQHLVDAAWVTLTRQCGFLGERFAEKLASCLCLPASLAFYCLGTISDPLDKRFALGWAVLAKND